MKKLFPLRSSLFFCASLLFILVFPGQALFALPIFNVVAYGAKGDGVTNNAVVIQHAIDDCTKAGGGDVVIPQGTFMSGPLELKSHVNLHLDMGAVLKGSPRMADYTVRGEMRGLIFAWDCIDIALTGDGEINGNSTFFMIPGKLHTFVDYDPRFTRQGNKFMHNFPGIGDGPLAHTARPDMMINLRHCSQVKIQGLHLTDPPNWTIRLGECENVKVSGLTILNDRLIPNNDGIHCTTSRNITISDCIISCGDDGIIVSGFGDETGVGGYTEKVKDQTYTYGNKTHRAQNITVSNCVIESSSAGLRVGYGMNNISELLFNNIVIHNSNRGILVQCRDNNLIENIRFSHITIDTRLLTGCWWGKGEPIAVSAMPQTGTLKTGKIKNVGFDNIIVKHAEAGIVLFADSTSSSLEQITLENIDLHIGRGPQTDNFGGNLDLRPTNNYLTGLYAHDLPAVYAHNVKKLAVKNMHISWEENLPSFFSSGFEADGFEDIQLDAISGRQAQSKGNFISLKSGNTISIANCKALAGTDVFFSQGPGLSRADRFYNNDERAAKTPFTEKKPGSFTFVAGNLLP